MELLIGIPLATRILNISPSATTFSGAFGFSASW
jgi:hypothetical protein